MLCIAASRQGDHAQDLDELQANFPQLKPVIFSGAIPTPDASQPFIWFGVSGGTESQFVSLKPETLPSPVIVYSVPRDNSSAAAQEIVQYMRERLIPCLHCQTIGQLDKALIGWKLLHEKFEAIKKVKLLAIGGFSDWLINEKPITFSSLPTIEDVSVEQLMAMNPINVDKIQGTGNFVQEHLEPAQELQGRLETLIQDRHAQGITLKCFDLLMTYKHHAACFPFARLQQNGILCACEGELSSLVGMTLVRELLQVQPSGIFMCNYLEAEKNRIKFAHCTAPLCGLEKCGSAEPYRLRTHYETGEGLAVTVQMKQQHVAIFKLRIGTNSIAHVMQGQIVQSGLDDIEECQCRTQIQVDVEKPTRMIGNHYLVCKATTEQVQQFKEALQVFGFMLV